MQKKLQITALVLAGLLAGCAGTDFKRPAPGALVVGQSRTADVTRVMGAPAQTGDVLKNNEQIRVYRYAYAEGAGSGRYPGVVPARSMVLSTHADVLVGKEFVSSFPHDATDFDESKLTAIVKGKSTRAEVEALLGAPNGEVVYPLIKDKRETGVVYSYSHAKGSVFDMRFYSKALVVAFDARNVVTDVEFASSGER